MSDKSSYYKNTQKTILYLSKSDISDAAIEAFKKEGAEKFLRELLEAQYSASITSRQDFETLVKTVLKEVCDEHDAFVLNYGGNPAWYYERRKFPERFNKAPKKKASKKKAT